MKEPEVPPGERHVRFDLKALQSADLPYSLLIAKSCDLSSFTFVWFVLCFHFTNEMFSQTTAAQLKPLMCPPLPEMQIILSPTFLMFFRVLAELFL